MISNDKELARAVDIVSKHLQQIQNYLGDDISGKGRLRLPKGYIRSVEHFRTQLFFISNDNIKNNLAYALVQSDVNLWLINRTNLYGVAREMTIKFAITLVGSISETLAITGTEGLIGKKHSFCERCNRMVEHGIISSRLRDQLHWLWKMRSAIHIYEIEYREYNKYKISDYNRAVSASRSLRKSLGLFHTKKLQNNHNNCGSDQSIKRDAGKKCAS